MTITHIIYIPFVGVGTNKRFSNEWLRYRIDIFKQFTLKSLQNQTEQDFTLWLSFREEDKENQLIKELYEYIKYPCVFTFSGLMYHDDRNAEANTTLEERLGGTLKQLSADTEYIYLTRIDSDDMFRNDVVDLIQSQIIDTKALTLQCGFVYNKDTQELAEWNPLTNPPFHTMLFDRETFFNPITHLAHYEGFKSHEDIARLPHRVLWQGDNRTDRLYCVLTHNPKFHISTTFNHKFRGDIIPDGEEKTKILKSFGIC